MLAGEAVVAIWNGIAPEGRAEFYEWHLHEHIPERVGIPGFKRGRRYIAADAATQPEFFTLYEAESFQVLQGQDYAGRLNAPTPWTRRATSHFRDTSRALARVLASTGVGPGGAILTLRFDLPDEAAEASDEIAALLPGIAKLPQVTGAHLCRSDDEASGIKTTESRDRTDITAPPRSFILVEACGVGPLANVETTLRRNRFIDEASAGRYLLEHTRLKTAWTAG